MRILILHSEPEEISSYLEGQLQGHELFWASEPEQVIPLLMEAEPEVVFSIKHSGFNGSFHAQALSYPSVRWFQVGGSGVDHLGSWDVSKVQVSNAAGVLAPFHAERAMAALLYLSTGISRALEAQGEKEWSPSSFETLLGKTLLILGYGKTGRELACRARRFGMKVVGVKRVVQEYYCSQAHEIHPLERLNELLEKAHVLSVNLPLNNTTRGLVGRAQLKRLPAGSFLLNASRGGVLCQESLLEALSSGNLRGAWLDVTDPEPLPPDSPLWSHPKILITAHCADLVSDYSLRFARFFCENLRRYEAGKELRNLLK